MKKIKNFKSLLFTVIGLTMLMTSCRKNDEISNPLDLYENFVAANAPQNQLFTIDAATGGQIVCKRGTKITFPPNAFANPDNSLTTGLVLVRVKEALDKSQWMLNKLSTTTNDNLLISGGMIDIEANRKSDGAELKPAPAMVIPTPGLANVIKAEVPRINNRPDTLRLFLPVQAGLPNTSKPPTSWAASYYPFGNGTNSYIFQIPQFHWVNCDGLWNQTGAKTTVRVTPDISRIVGAKEVQVLFVYRNISTVITLPPFATYMESYENSIPVGSTADVVCIGKDGLGKIIFKVMPATTFTDHMDISIKPVATSAAAVNAYLNSINN